MLFLRSPHLQSPMSDVQSRYFILKGGGAVLCKEVEILTLLNTDYHYQGLSQLFRKF